jgi:hypothetical protein
MKFFKWFFNLFKSNKVIMQLAIQSIAGEYLMRHPEAKIPIQKAIEKTLEDISSYNTPLESLPTLIKENIKITGVSAPTLALTFVLIDQLSVPVMAYINKANLTPIQDAYAIVEILGWINDIAKA